MEHAERIRSFMNELVYATKHDIGDLMAHEGVWKPGTSAVNNSYKYLEEDVGGYLEKGKSEKGGFYKLKGKKGNHDEHSRLVTAELVKIKKIPYETKIFRECFIGEKGLIPDALILTINGNKAACWILEVKNFENESFYAQKVHTWEAWEEANGYLSNLFGVKVKAFQLINKAEEVKNG